MRVAFVTHNFPRHPGDQAGSFLLRLAVALGADGVTVRVYAPESPGHPAVDEIEGVAVRRFRYAPPRLETIAYTGTMATAVRGSWGARLALAGMIASGAAASRHAARRWGADVVHAHWWFPGGLAAALPFARAAAPLVVTLHGSDVRLAAGLRPARRLFRLVARRAGAVTAVSRWLCDEAVAMAPGLACAVAPMPVATDLFTPDAAIQRSGCLFVGRLNAQKGVASLLRALARQRHPEPLTVVGDGPDAGALRRLAGDLGVQRHVRWHPPVAQSRLPAFYREARALVVPSVDEGLGLVAVEALLCETPVVALASGGLPDIVADGRTGWLVPPGDDAALAAALDDVAVSSRLAELGRNGRRAMLAAFEPAAVAARYRAIYESVAGRRAPGPSAPRASPT